MDLTHLQKAVRDCASFNGFNDDHLDFLVMNGQTKDFPEGSTIYQKGESSHGTFCLIVSGSVNIISEDGETLYDIGPGNIIGEIGTISPQNKRTITVRALEPVETVEWNLGTIEKEIPPLFEKLWQLARERTLNWYYY